MIEIIISSGSSPWKRNKTKTTNGITATQEQRTYTFTHRFQTKAKSLKYVLSIFSILLLYLLRTYATSCELNVSFKNNSLVQLIHQKKWIFMSYSSFFNSLCQIKSVENHIQKGKTVSKYEIFEPINLRFAPS